MTGVPFEFLPPPECERPYTISEINEGLSLILESANMTVWVEGEISNWRVSSNGHSYFRLKDAASQVPAVMWRQSVSRLSFEPEDGLAVLAIATITVYQKAGYYQLNIHRLEPRGKGALFIAFEQLKKRLEKEGLFDPAHKIPLPASVRKLGVITSKQGAAVHDILRVVASRSPQTDIILVDVPVQGETAAPRIAAALHDLNAFSANAGDDPIDCIIIGRGGGSVEDLWPFNEEIVARAIYQSEVPVISAVGHEIDFTIADFVADVRAPTPSAAAEIAVPDREENKRFFEACASRFSGAVTRSLSNVKERFDSCLSNRNLRLPVRLFLERQQTTDGLSNDFAVRYNSFMQSLHSRFSSASSRLQSVSPLAVLSRGYSVVTTDDDIAIRDSTQVAVGENISVRFQKGSARAKITEVHP
jgi:exodeoxyribonuclease VII large subunit